MAAAARTEARKIFGKILWKVIIHLLESSPQMCQGLQSILAVKKHQPQPEVFDTSGEKISDSS